MPGSPCQVVSSHRAGYRGPSFQAVRQRGGRPRGQSAAADRAGRRFLL